MSSMPPALPHDPYMTAVDAAFTAAGIDSEDGWTSGYDEYEPDGIHTTLSAVFSWPGGLDPGNGDEHPSGLGVYWSAPAGWEYASKRPDGSNEIPQELGVELWASPAAVATAVSKVLGGDTPAPNTELWTGAEADEVQAAVELWRRTEQ